MSRSHPFPLGAHPHPDGTRFAVECPGAERVQLCLVDEKTERRVELARTQGVWHGVVDGVGPDQHYGYRVHGPAHDPAKLLLDPSARRISGVLGEADVLATPGADTLGHVPLSVVTAPPRPPAPAPAPARADVDAVVYEVHVGAATATHPDVPPELRGTYLGLAHPVVVAHLGALGVTVVELLPVAAFLDEPGLRARGMRNHWGYAPAACSAPHPGYASRPGAEQEEVQTLVDTLHAAGIAVWVDVVHNHTCEGEPDGPVIGFRGYGGYYLPDGHDLTGCGNTLDAGSPLVVRMVLDSLRHWASLGGDGFASTSRACSAGPGVAPSTPRRGCSPRSPPTRCWPGAPWWPSPGTRPVTGTRSGPSVRSGRNGTTTSATPCATSGAGRRAAARWPYAWPARRTWSAPAPPPRA